jgi:hypothetical protein
MVLSCTKLKENAGAAVYILAGNKMLQHPAESSYNLGKQTLKCYGSIFRSVFKYLRRTFMVCILLCVIRKILSRVSVTKMWVWIGNWIY